MIMAAVALPAIGRTSGTTRSSAAVREACGEIQAARNKAIMKNVNFGVVFVHPEQPRTYRVRRSRTTRIRPATPAAACRGP